MNSQEIRRRFLDFFEKRGHAVIPSSSLVPEGDSSTLFTTAGMQPLVPYLLGSKHPSGKRLVDVQKCVRTGDIDDIGDNTHLTFFEMLGNWSLGDYFKEDAIRWSYELLTSKEEGFGLDPSRLYVTVFAGDENAPRDEEAKKIWIASGIPEHRIYYLGADANWWPNVKGEDTWTGPTGPSSEMFYDLTPDGLGDLTHDEFMRADAEQKVVEIWNDVFMTYEKKNGKIVGELKSKNVDTGAGLERLTAVLQNKKSVFDTDLFEPIMAVIPEGDLLSRRVLADHIRTAVFMIADNVEPSNTDSGYVLRRIIRRAVRFADTLGIAHGKLGNIADMVIHTYEDIYEEVKFKHIDIVSTIEREENQFRVTLEKGLKQLEKISGNISGEEAFALFSTYGFPVEMTRDVLREKGFSVAIDGFYKAMEKHQDKSRTATVGKFKGGLADHGEETTRLHTAHHLLLAALQKVLGADVKQRGSNITPERLRMDFTFDRKLTNEEKEDVEKQVNEWIEQGLTVISRNMSLDEAEKIGAEMEFGQKYPDMVNVYMIENEDGEVVSKECCGGPHVTNTSKLGVFKIKKEESSSAGVRRIKGVLE
jgi:alanyl-tRNA synthetase